MQARMGDGVAFVALHVVDAFLYLAHGSQFDVDDFPALYDWAVSTDFKAVVCALRQELELRFALQASRRLLAAMLVGGGHV
jgi:hypothetical protein